MPALLDRGLFFFFRLHDGLSVWLARNFFSVKKALLLIAHLSLFGFFFPDWRTSFGEAGGNLLIFILFLSPLSKIFRLRLLQQLMGLRRELGIMFGYLVTVHGVGYMLDPNYALVLGNFLPFDIFSLETPFLLGVLAYTLTLPLLFTSNNLANRLLGGRNWKRLHRIVYVMALLVIAHRFMMRGQTNLDLIQSTLLIVGYCLAQLLAWRNFLPPLVRVINWVASRYQAYRKSLLSAPAITHPSSTLPPAVS